MIVKNRRRLCIAAAVSRDVFFDDSMTPAQHDITLAITLNIGPSPQVA